MCRDQLVAGFGEQSLDLLPLGVSDLDRDPPAVLQMLAALSAIAR